mgnify:CR=1 FL=1
MKTSRFKDKGTKMIERAENQFLPINIYNKKSKNNLILLDNVKIEIGDLRNLSLPNNSIDGIITSPPYSIALDYVQNDIHSLGDLGYDVVNIRASLSELEEMVKLDLNFIMKI